MGERARSNGVVLMYWATLNTFLYRFDAFGFTAEDAIATLRETWEEHATRTSAGVTWEEVAPEAGVTFTRAGDGWRDFELLINTNQPPREREEK